MGGRNTKPKKGKKDPSSSSSSSSSSTLPSSSSLSTPSHQPPPSSSSQGEGGEPINKPIIQSSNNQVPPSPKSEHSKSLSHSSSLKSDDKALSMKRLEELFEKYKDPDNPNQIGPDGIEGLCKDLGVDPDDVVILVLAWHLNAQSMGFFKRDEFIGGLQRLGVDSISKLKNQLNNIKKDLDDPVKYKEIYRFAFGFAKERDQKILDLAIADALLGLVMGNRFPHGDHLRQYLIEQKTYKSVNMDQWMNILEFSRTIKADFTNYDENGAWPVLLDEYCEWAKEKFPA